MDGLTYKKCSTYRISSPQIWSSLTYLSAEKAVKAVAELLEKHEGKDFDLRIEYVADGQIIEDFDEETQSSPMLKAKAERM